MTYQQKPYEQVASFLSSKTKYRPEIGIICGSGLSGLSKSLSETETFKYEDIPGFPEATVAGHHGELVFGVIGGIETVCMRGRFHFYEGNSMDKVVLPVRVMRLMGVKLLIVTNAAGGLNPEFEVGDIMVIQDHFGGVSLIFLSFLSSYSDCLFPTCFISILANHHWSNPSSWSK
jgi:purine-nucleoside phosphorylase